MKTGEHKIPDPVPLGEVAWKVATTDPPAFIPTGLEALDDLIVGATNGDLTIIAGRPSEGKTSLCMQIAEHAAAGGVNVGVFSLEMGPEALSLRQIAAHSGVSILKLRRRIQTALTPAEQGAIEEAADYLKTLPICVDTRSGLTGEQVYETVAQWQKQGVGLVILDYIQLMEGDSENRQEAVGKNTRMLKNAARDFKLPMIALSQVSRASSSREDKKPRMSDLRDSGQIEQVGDTIIMLHYPNPDDAMESIRECDIYAVKQRQGPVGFASVYFNKPKTRFQDKPGEKGEPQDAPASQVKDDEQQKVWG